MSSIWENPISHGEILKRVWKNFELGVTKGKHPFHTPVFGTVDGGGPSLRTVILRRFWKSPPRLAFHAHAGSPKIEQVKSEPSAAWLFYHPVEKFQVRVRGMVEIHTDDELADEQWSRTKLFARRCYMGKAPSERSSKPTSGMPNDLIDSEPTQSESESGRENFAVISSSIDSIDFVELDVRGHRRALFEWDTNGGLKTSWLTP